MAEGLGEDGPRVHDPELVFHRAAHGFARRQRNLVDHRVEKGDGTGDDARDDIAKAEDARHAERRCARSIAVTNEIVAAQNCDAACGGGATRLEASGQEPKGGFRRGGARCGVEAAVGADGVAGLWDGRQARGSGWAWI